MRFLHFILSHSIFIACCAVGLCYETNLLLHIRTDNNLLAFIFFSTLCSYNYYWLLSKFYFVKNPTLSSFIKKNYSFIIMFAFAALGTLYFLFLLKSILLFVVVGVLLTLLYSMPLWPFSFTKALQKIGLFKTILLASTWAYVTTILPSTHLLNTHLFPILLLLAQRFFFMLLLCILFDLRDISVDKLHGLHSLATDMGYKKMDTVLVLVFVFYLFTTLLFCWQYADINQAISFIITAAIFWLVYRFSLKKRGYVFYYFVVDGLMFVSALGTYLASIW